MLELAGKYAMAKIFANNIEESCIEQIKRVLNHPIFEDAKIRIMPDCHTGKGSVIGFTSTMPKNGEIIPNLIGVDQSCGMLCVKLKPSKNDRDFLKFDKVIRNNIPLGTGASRKTIHKLVLNNDELIDKVKEACSFLNIDVENQLKKIGSLGGGNHFISIEEGKSGKYLIIHSGSRNIGATLAEYFQRIAIEKNCYGESYLKELSWIDGKDAEKYLYFANVCDMYARESRKIMAYEILDKMDIEEEYEFTTVHNYMNQNDKIIRKGAVSCREKEKILIPINMAYGSFIAEGLGNDDWNNSAPHGAGRLCSRTEAKSKLSMKDYKEAMKGVHSECISTKTIDESPMAYKNGDEIKKLVIDTAKIIDELKPIYNYKAQN